MRIVTGTRIAFRPSARIRYWALRRLIDRMSALRRPEARPFIRVLLRDWIRFMIGSVRPVHGQTWERAEAAVAWLLRAQDATCDDGVSQGYFPGRHDTMTGWLASYPETTGYIIPSLLTFAALSNRK